MLKIFLFTTSLVTVSCKKVVDTKIYFDVGNPPAVLTERTPEDLDEKGKFYNILAIDGGGIRGLLSA
jgi:hypothetical protein